MELFNHDKDRVKSISDGIFAFAATLVVVSLDMPESFEELREMKISLISFAASFAALIFI
ncbi:MAG: TMEM175 family protein [Nonlabens sp.]